MENIQSVIDSEIKKKLIKIIDQLLPYAIQGSENLLRGKEIVEKAEREYVDILNFESDGKRVLTAYENPKKSVKITCF